MEFDLLITQEADKAKVFIAYGLVMNLVQECELSMIQTYYAIKMKKGEIKSFQDKSDLYSKRLSDTFGSLVSILSDQNYLDTDLIEKLRKIKKLRDNLAHTFFKENMPEIKTIEGRKLIINGMGHSYDYIDQVKIKLQSEMVKIFKEFNFTDQDIIKFVDSETKNWLLSEKAGRLDHI